MPAGATGCKIGGPRMYGKHQTKNLKFLVCQQGPQGAKLGTLGCMCQQGPQGAKLGALGCMASIRLKIKNSWYAMNPILYKSGRLWW